MANNWLAPARWQDQDLVADARATANVSADAQEDFRHRAFSRQHTAGDRQRGRCRAPLGYCKQNDPARVFGGRGEISRIATFSRRRTIGGARRQFDDESLGVDTAGLVLERAAKPGASTALDWDPTSRRLATTIDDGTVVLLDPQTNRIVERIPHNSRVRDIRFTPDGNYLITTSQSLQIWDIARRVFVYEQEVPHTCMAIDPRRGTCCGSVGVEYHTPGSRIGSTAIDAGDDRRRRGSVSNLARRQDLGGSIVSAARGRPVGSSHAAGNDAFGMRREPTLRRGVLARRPAPRGVRQTRRRHGSHLGMGN